MKFHVTNSLMNAENNKMASCRPDVDRYCCICWSKIVNNHYRNLGSEDSKRQLGGAVQEIGIEMRGLCCSKCATRINRITTLNYYIATKLNVLKAEKHKALTKIRSFPGVMLQNSILGMQQVKEEPDKTPSASVPTTSSEQPIIPVLLTGPMLSLLPGGTSRLVDKATQTVTLIPESEIKVERA